MLQRKPHRRTHIPSLRAQKAAPVAAPAQAPPSSPELPVSGVPVPVPAPAEGVQTSTLMDNLFGVVGGAAEAATESSTQIASRIQARGGLRGVLQAAGLQLSTMLGGGAAAGGAAPAAGAAGGAPSGFFAPSSGAAGGGATTFGNTMGVGGSGAAAAGGAGYAPAGPGYASPDPSQGYGGGVSTSGAGGNVQSVGGGVGTAGAGGGVAVAGGAGGIPVGGVGVGTGAGVVVTGGLGNIGTDPIYGAGIYGASTAAGLAAAGVGTNNNVFYGGSYGGAGVFYPGRSIVRVYLFPTCVIPELAATWPGCWCALCYADIDPATTTIGGQRLLNDYALVANALAANALREAAIKAQRIAGAQAVSANINARIVTTAVAVLRDAQTTAGLLYAARQRTKQTVTDAVRARAAAAAAAQQPCAPACSDPAVCVASAAPHTGIRVPQPHVRRVKRHHQPARHHRRGQRLKGGGRRGAAAFVLLRERIRVYIWMCSARSSSVEQEGHPLLVLVRLQRRHVQRVAQRLQAAALRRPIYAATPGAARRVAPPRGAKRAEAQRIAQRQKLQDLRVAVGARVRHRQVAPPVGQRALLQHMRSHDTAKWRILTRGQRRRAQPRVQRRSCAVVRLSATVAVAAAAAAPCGLHAPRRHRV
jgi:hypothetical protein